MINSSTLCPSLFLDPNKRHICINGKNVPLRNKEYHLLTYFLKNAGKVLSRTQILEDVWDRNIFCQTNTVDVHVSSLRRKLRNHTKNTLIKTIHCVGYIFNI